MNKEESAAPEPAAPVAEESSEPVELVDPAEARARLAKQAAAKKKKKLTGSAAVAAAAREKAAKKKGSSKDKSKFNELG